MSKVPVLCGTYRLFKGTSTMWDVPVIQRYQHYVGRTGYSKVPALCGTYRSSQMEKYYPADLTYYCKDKKEKACLPIDIAAPDDSNFDAEETEKLSKYKDLGIDIRT